MTNSLQFTKKALVVAVAAATILWTVGISAFVPQQASAASFGDLIRGESLSTLYYYGSDGQRYAFPNEKTYFSWYADFSGVKTISDDELAGITLAGNVAYRPGSRWIKITSDEKVYAVSNDGSIHWVESEEVAKGLAGDNWNTFIDDVPDVFFVDYTVGASLTSAEDGYPGMLYKDSDGDTHLIMEDGEYAVVTDAGFSANGYQAGAVLSGTGVDLSGLTGTDDVSSEKASLTDAAQMVETDSYEETQDITVSLSSNSPASATLVAGQGIGHLATLKFMNSTSKAVEVTSVKVKRTGVSSDTTLSNVYLFDGYMRTSDSATVSSGHMTWNDTGGLFEIPAGGSKEVAVRADIATGTSGQTLGVQLSAAADVSFDGAYAASGSFPIKSAEHTVATVSNFATVSFGTTTTPSANSSVDPQDDYRIWENTITVANNEVLLKTLRFRNIGSIDAEDIKDFTLYVDGTKRGEMQAEQDDNGYFSFDMTADPVKVNTGNHVVKVLADIVGGSTRTVTLGMRNTADAVFVDEDYEQPVLVQANSTTFSARDAGAQTIASGALTFTKMSDSPSGDIVNNASGLTLATWEVKASGEAMKVENLNFNFVHDDNDTDFTLRNGAVFWEGSQIGSTTDLCNDDTSVSGLCTGVAGSGASYTQYTFGSSMVVYPGSPGTLEIRADIYDDPDNDSIATDDTIKAVIDAGAASSNVLRMTSGSYISSPSADVSGNTLTVKEGSLTLAEYGSYADQTTVAPKTEYLLGKWVMTATTAEDINLTQIDVDWTGADAADASDDLTNLYVKYGPSGNMTETNTKATVADSDNQWSIDYDIEAGETIFFEVYGNVASSAFDDATTADTLTGTLQVNATTIGSSASANTSAIGGQTITMGAGSFSTIKDGSSPVAFLAAGNQEITAAHFRLTAVNEPAFVNEIQAYVPDVTAAKAVSEMRFYDGDTLLGSAPIATTDTTVRAALLTGLNWEIPADSFKVVTVKLMLNDIGTSKGPAADAVTVTLSSVKYSDDQGVQTTDTNDRAANEVRVYKSVPTFAHVDLTNSTLVNGQATDLYKFTVTADSNGPVSLKQITYGISWTDGGTADTLEVESLEFYQNGTEITSSVGIWDQAGNTIESTSGALEADTDIVVNWDSDTTGEGVVAAGETTTYVLRGTPQGFRTVGSDTSGDTFSIYLEGDSAHADASGTTGLTEVCLEDSSTSGNLFALDNADAAYGDCAAANTGVTDHNLIWSDNSDNNHLSGIDTNSSADWWNGYLVLDLDLDAESWTK